ncbi:MAG: hypothetical protein RI897_2089 [Verrucomicrobiota bacterium]
MIRRVDTAHTPESLVGLIPPGSRAVLLRSQGEISRKARYSLVTGWPFLSFRSWGAQCRLECEGRRIQQYGDPWLSLATLVARYEMGDSVDVPFPLGGCFGSWGYDLKGFLEPTVGRRAAHDLALPDCDLGFYDSLVVFDHVEGVVLVVATGIRPDGSRSARAEQEQVGRWLRLLETSPREGEIGVDAARGVVGVPGPEPRGSMSRESYLRAVVTAQSYIRSGDIYQVNISHRLSRPWRGDSWGLYRQLSSLSPAPFGAWMDFGDYGLVSSSPELFMLMSGGRVETRPIKGTRPRDADPVRDAQLSYELQSSDKERAELLMITDLLRNDLGRVCDYGTVRVPDLLRLERYAQVQHLVSTVEGQLRSDVSHFQALAACFPGGSITGAPKIRAMQIIDELEPVSRGPYTGALGYLGFNRESQLSIAIRVALVREGIAYYHAGAGIVADSDPVAEYEETLVKAAAFRQLQDIGVVGEGDGRGVRVGGAMSGGDVGF